MGIYDDLGVRTVINAAGTLTRLGGSRLSPAVLAAMADASASFVHIDELQARAGDVIAQVTGAEAGYVASGAAAALATGTAACVTGMDVAAMDQLPDTTGLRNEIVVQRAHEFLGGQNLAPRDAVDVGDDALDLGDVVLTEPALKVWRR